MRRSLHVILGALGVLLLAGGMLLHLTVRDGVRLLAPVYYGMPLPLLMVGWLGLAAWFLRRPRVLVGCLAMAVIAGAWWQAVSYGGGAGTPGPAAGTGPARRLKVMSWNMAHQRLPSAELEAVVRAHLPDIVGLGEVGLRHGDPNPLMQSPPPGYTLLRPEHGMAVVVRGSVQDRGVTRLAGKSKFVEMEATVDGRIWHVILVDGDAAPLKPRQELLDRVRAVATARGRNTLVLGDFNTPVESVWFDSWRDAGLHHASEGHRAGFRETWPRPWPVLSIDHIWSSPELPPAQTTRLFMQSSDHLAVLTALEIP